MKNKKIMLLTFIFALSITLLLAGCGNQETESTDELQKVTLTLDWDPNTNHTGLFVAKELGYYEEAGLDVDIIQQSGTGTEQLVATGNSHFGISYQEAVTFARVEEVPVVSVAAIIQQNTSGFASLKDRNIVTPADFQGKKYGGWGSPVEEATIRALMDAVDADFQQVEIVTTGAADFFATVEQNADFAWIYYGWDGIKAELEDIDLNYIPLIEFDSALDYYTPVIITSENLIEEDPELVQSFIQATSKGYDLAIADPEKAASILMEHAPELDEELVYASQEWLAEKYQADAAKWGWQEKENWVRYTQWLYDNNLIEVMPDPDQAFSNQFIQEGK